MSDKGVIYNIKEKTNAMDALSQELQDFLIRLGKEPGCVSEKVEHYIKHIMHLVYADEEDMLQQYYGLFGNDVKPLEDIEDGGVAGVADGKTAY